MAARRESLVAAWESRINLEIERGSDPAQAVELLDLDALHGAMGVEFNPLMFSISPPTRSKGTYWSCCARRCWSAERS